MIRVTETVHHGSYRHVRVVEVDDFFLPVLANMVEGCPYPSHGVNLQVMRMALESGGSYSHGWVDWEVQR